MYRGPHADRIDAGHLYAKDVKDVIDFNTSGNVALFMAEPIQGAGGLIPQPRGFVNEAAEYVRDAGGLYLSDEV
jgi:alanine-glyoxylate transaminase/(R)-3-amino-2-methylpropionate-pyruvate transaminase